MMKKLLLASILLLVLGGGYYLTKGKQPTGGETSVAPTEQNAMPVPESSDSSAMKEKEVIREFTIDSTEFAFSPTTMTVKKGETVQVTLTNSGKMQHDWVVDELNAKTKTIKAGETDTVSFVADRVGTFEYYCSVGNHRKLGMVGKLIVTE